MGLSAAGFLAPLTLVSALTLISPDNVWAREAAAQDPRGALMGRVEDSSGAPIADAEVRATNVTTSISVSGRTSSAGVYSILFLQPGTYSVTVALPGFRTFVREAIQVRVSETVEVNVSMEVGDVAETLQVRQHTPVLETAQASLGLVIDERRIQDLPMLAGNPLELGLLAPGVVEGSRFIWKPAFSFHQVAIDGNGPLSNEFQIDGVANTFAEVDNGRTRYAFAPPASAVREFKVQTAPFDASVGHVMGGLINVSTAGGTNRLRGEGHWFYRSSDLSARDYFAKKAGTESPEFDDNRYGFSAGGPLKLPKLYDGSNKTFWFYTWEANQWGFPLTFTGTVPTAAQRQGDFSQLLALGPQYQIYDPLTTAIAPGGRLARQPFANNIIPLNRLDPVGLRLVNLYPLPNQPGTIDGRNNYFRALMATEDYKVHFARLDHAFNDSHRMFVRGHYDSWEEDKNHHFDNDVNGLVLNRINRGVAIDDVYVRGKMVFNLRYGFTQQEFPEYRTSRGTDLAGLGFAPALVSLVDPELATIPRIRAGGYSTISPWETGDGTTESLTHTFVGSVSTVRGRHSLKAGADVRIYRAHGNRYPQSVSPDLNFTSTYTRGPLDNSSAAPIGQELASMLLGIPDGVMVRPASFVIQDRYLGIFVQDDFQVTPRLTLNVGVRYEIEQPLTEREDRLVAGFAFDTPNPIEPAAQANYALNPIPELPVDSFRVRGGLTWVGQNGLGRSPFRGETNNFMPRVGIAYHVLEDTVLRAGYGMFYDSIGVGTTRALQTGFSQATPIQASLDNGVTYVATLANPLPQGLLEPRGSAGGLTTNLGQNLEFYDRERKHPHSHRWSIGLQQLLPGQILAEATYVGNHGANLAAVRNINATPLRYLSTQPTRDQARIDFLTTQIPDPFYGLDPIYAATISRANLLRPFPHFGNISVQQSVGSSWYHSVQLRGEKRLSHGYTLQATYTWSRLREAIEFLNAADAMPTDVVGAFDRPHRVTISGIWEIPVGRDRRFGANLPAALNAALGGWQLSVVGVHQSGPPLNFGNILFTGDLEDIALPRGERTDTRWFNIDAGFNRNPAQQLDGNVRTFPLRIGEARADGRATWDVSAAKHFQVERIVLQVRADVYNVLNRANFAEPNTSPTSSDFGVTTRLGTDPRNAQFSLKLTF